MAHSRDEDFDDEDYQPRRGQSGNGIPLFLLVGLLGAAVVGFLLFAARHRQAAMEHAEIEHAEQAQRKAAQIGEEPFKTPGENWPKVLGAWVRQPTGPGDTAVPYRFEFYRNLTAQVTHLHPDGSIESRHFQVDILVDERDQLAVRLRDGETLFSFQFRLTPDRTIALRNGSGELVFSRP